VLQQCVAVCRINHERDRQREREYVPVSQRVAGVVQRVADRENASTYLNCSVLQCVVYPYIFIFILISYIYTGHTHVHVHIYGQKNTSKYLFMYRYMHIRTCQNMYKYLFVYRYMHIHT